MRLYLKVCLLSMLRLFQLINLTQYISNFQGPPKAPPLPPPLPQDSSEEGPPWAKNLKKPNPNKGQIPAKPNAPASSVGKGLSIKKGG